MSAFLQHQTLAPKVSYMHTYPLNDLREHDLCLSCWCKPTLDDEVPLVIHNSMDERESYEQGRKLQ